MSDARIEVEYFPSDLQNLLCWVRDVLDFLVLFSWQMVCLHLPVWITARLAVQKQIPVIPSVSNSVRKVEIVLPRCFIKREDGCQIPPHPNALVECDVKRSLSVNGWIAQGGGRWMREQNRDIRIHHYFAVRPIDCHQADCGQPFFVFSLKRRWFAFERHAATKTPPKRVFSFGRPLASVLDA